MAGGDKSVPPPPPPLLSCSISTGKTDPSVGLSIFLSALLAGGGLPPALFPSPAGGSSASQPGSDGGASTLPGAGGGAASLPSETEYSQISPPVPASQGRRRAPGTNKRSKEDESYMKASELHKTEDQAEIGEASQVRKEKSTSEQMKMEAVSRLASDWAEKEMSRKVELERSAKELAKMEASTSRRLESERWAKQRAEKEAASQLESERSAKEQAEKESVRRARLDSLRRRGLLRSPGSILVNLDNCEKIRATLDFDRFLGISRPVEKEEFLVMEKHIWKAAMNFWKSKDISCEYDLISDNMTMYPVVFERHYWYHCNLMGQKRDLACPSYVFIFVEVKCKSGPKGRSYTVMSCVILDEKSGYDCKICPTSMDIRHPPMECFTCGSQDGQNVFFYTIPGTPCSSDSCHNKTATTMESTTSTSCFVTSFDNCCWLKG